MSSDHINKGFSMKRSIGEFIALSNIANSLYVEAQEGDNGASWDPVFQIYIIRAIKELGDLSQEWYEKHTDVLKDFNKEKSLIDTKYCADKTGRMNQAGALSIIGKTFMVPVYEVVNGQQVTEADGTAITPDRAYKQALSELVDRHDKAMNVLLSFFKEPREVALEYIEAYYLPKEFDNEIVLTFEPFVLKNE